MNKNIAKILLFIAIPIVAIVGVSAMVGQRYNDKADIYSEVVGYFYDDNVKSFSLDWASGELTYTLREAVDNKEVDKSYSIVTPGASVFYNDVNDHILEYNNNPDNADSKIEYEYKKGNETGWLLDIIPLFFTVIVIIGFWIFMSRRMGKMMGDDKTMSFGKIKTHKPENSKRKTTFADVAGADEEKAELEEIVEFLKNPKKYNEMD